MVEANGPNVIGQGGSGNRDLLPRPVRATLAQLGPPYETKAHQYKQDNTESLTNANNR